ncbi:ESCRT-II complex subunit-domain-containing protein [Neurospora tetraspora]|uniref:ESCRT-II complex subunit VPS25 n=1 Tax=Neurospora tetraspora TaxID=94610 RepID=A0AAE0JD37_9PEZI|nr:ESCRT-II complex subunit-domain-containing protein [Neurospora tetraspora]
MSTTPPAPSDSSTPNNPKSTTAGTLLPNDTYPFPREFFFPPFFTRQTNLTTHHAQLTKWSSLLLSYCRHHRLFRVSLSPDTLPFNNPRINRRLALGDIKGVVDFLKKDGRAEYVPLGQTNKKDGTTTTTRGGGGAGEQEGGEAFIYWRTPEEWGTLIEGWVEETGQRGSVLTVYELREGEGTRGTEIWGMDGDVLVKALGTVVKRGKAQIFQSGEDSLGVKFF